MKVARYAAIGAALVLGVSAAAVSQPPVGNGKARQDRPAAGARQHARGAQDGARRQPGAGFQRALFRGITLTDAQKNQLKTIQTRFAEQRRSLMPRREAGVRPDSATRVQFQARARELQQKQIAEVRGILTADQQRAFDANVATFRQRAEARGEGKGRGERGGERGARRGAQRGA